MKINDLTIDENDVITSMSAVMSEQESKTLMCMALSLLYHSHRLYWEPTKDGGFWKFAVGVPIALEV